MRLQATSGCDDVTEDFWHEHEGLPKATRGDQHREGRREKTL